MMAYLLDTNVLARLANSSDAQHSVALRAVVELYRLGEKLHVSPQVLIEFRNVATRPAAVNGLGLSGADAEIQATGFEAMFPLLPDTPDIFHTWKALVSALDVKGKPVHDARLVAVCHTHGVTHLLTFNVSHFTRMAAFGPGLAVVDPNSI